MIKQIRAFLKEQKLGALLIARTDSFLGEYYPPEVDTLWQATGFSGSAGMAVVTADRAVLFVDSRYTEQARQETSFEVYEVPTQTTVSDWILQNIPELIIGYNPRHRSVMWVTYMRQKGIRLKEVGKKEWDHLFPVKAVPVADSFDYDLAFCGESVESKIKKVVAVLQEKRLDAYVLTVPDSVSYLLNKRSLTVPEYPVVFERRIIFADGRDQALGDDVSVLAGKKVGMDLALTPVNIFQKVQAVATVVPCPDPVEQMKAIKNKTEQENIRQACLFESAVICRFLAWVEQHKEHIDEWMCGQTLAELRAESPLYRGDSFDTIAAVGAHAALAHYQATPASSVPVTSAPLLLVDTGGNYLNGTTDMTRTICVGKPTAFMKKRYTQVLKGHIALARARIKEGSLPARLDQKARSFLRADGVDYGHSTGHGIGMYLAVHEAPPTIYETANTPLKAGMVFSNEPAYYDIKKGFGIRLENMILTQSGPNQQLILENLLWIPFDGRLIDWRLLTSVEKKWLKQYHQTIIRRVFPLIPAEDRQVLSPLLDFFVSNR